MKILSPFFKNNQEMPAKYTCDGENINPPLEFVDVPKEARSLVLIVDDPDAVGGTFVHWTVFNINPRTETIDEDSVPPDGIQGMTDSGEPEYKGPCPPSGSHRYFFKLYALDINLTLRERASKKEIEDGMKNHILEKAEIIGLYKRSKS